MKGINFVTDESKKIVAVQIDVRKNKQLWEDLQDYLAAEQSKKSKKTKLADFKKELKKAGKL